MQNSELMEFHKKLYRLIKGETGGSYERLVEALKPYDVEVSTSTVGNWARGEYWPDLKAAAAIARIYGVSLDYLAFPEFEAFDPASQHPLILPAGPEAPPANRTRRVAESPPLSDHAKRKRRG